MPPHGSHLPEKEANPEESQSLRGFLVNLWTSLCEPVKNLFFSLRQFELGFWYNPKIPE